MKIDLSAHYGFASLPGSYVTPGEGGVPVVTPGEGGGVRSPLMVLQRLNCKIGAVGGEGGPVTAPSAD